MNTKAWYRLSEARKERLTLLTVASIIKKRIVIEIKNTYKNHKQIHKVISELPSILNIDFWFCIRNTLPSSLFNAALADLTVELVGQKRNQATQKLLDIATTTFAVRVRSKDDN